jgi:hypothetical protein
VSGMLTYMSIDAACQCSIGCAESVAGCAEANAVSLMGFIS